jgi:hypothetical protein
VAELFEPQARRYTVKNVFCHHPLLKIAHGFSRGFSSAKIPKSRQGRKNRSAVPRGTFHFRTMFYPALKGWAIIKKPCEFSP